MPPSQGGNVIQGADNAGLGPIPTPTNRSQLVADALREAILRGELEPGTAIVERDIAAKLQVSKTPVREALRLLRSSGLIEEIPYRGVSVARVTPELVTAGYELRLMLEPAATELSCLRGQAETAAAAREAFTEAAEHARVENRAALALANRRFHRALYSFCGNDLLVPILDGLQDRMAFIAVAGWRRSKTWETEAEEHGLILEAVEAGDAESARRHAHDHIAKSLERMIPPNESETT